MPVFPQYDGPPLMSQVCEVENFTRAWRRVRSNIRMALRNRSAGPDEVTIRDFEADWARQMDQLAEELRSGRYRPLPPRRFSIPKRHGGERAIAILAVRDRVAQRAVQQVLEPLFEPYFIDCSYGCRPHVGVPEAVSRVTRYAAQGLTWVVDADIASYFDSIDHRILLGLVRQRINDVALLQLLARWLEVGALQSAEAAPITARPPTLLSRGGDAIRRALSGNTGQLTPPVEPNAAAGYGFPSMEHIGSEGWAPTPAGLEQRIWTWMLLAKPIASGVQLAWPYVRRFGGRRLALAGAVAASAVAASEAIARSGMGEGRGAVQGGALSPLLANIYLHPFDLALTSQGLRMVRFMDDFVVMCADLDEAERALELARRQLAVIRLSLNQEKTRVARFTDGLEFLGQALAPRQRGVRLEDGLKNFEEAQQALRKAADGAEQRVRNAARSVRRRAKRPGK